jgi:3,4-dihydroxy 2-butanone 4-phosphate synthase/GTP cyclohydrolase II
MSHRTHPQESAGDNALTAADAPRALLQDLMNARARRRSLTRPFVTLAYAQSVDGSITIARGQRYALSGPDSLRLTHTLRACHDAILVGVGTVLADNPELRVRLVEGRDPQPVIVDSHLRTPLLSKLLTQSGRPLWIGATDQGDAESPERRTLIEARGARVIACPAEQRGWVDLPALLGRLRADGIEHVMVEGGARIITSFLEARLVDYVVVTIAPLFMGGLSAVGPLARAAAAGSTSMPPPPAVGPHLPRWMTARLGDDLVLSGEAVWRAE